MVFFVKDLCLWIGEEKTWLFYNCRAQTSKLLNNRLVNCLLKRYIEKARSSWCSKDVLLLCVEFVFIIILTSLRHTIKQTYIFKSNYTYYFSVVVSFCNNVFLYFKSDQISNRLFLYVVYDFRIFQFKGHHMSFQ